MKRLFTLILVFFALYLGFQIAYKYTVGGYKETYEIRKETVYKINETYTTNKKKEHDNYYLTISDGTNVFTYQIYEDLNKVEHIVKDIYSYSDDNYTCILPIFKNNKKLVDITCLSNGVQYYYHNIIGRDSALDSFVSSFEEEVYTVSTFEDSAQPKNEDDYVTLYQDNLVSDHYAVFQDYRGAYFLNSFYSNFSFHSELFDKDHYNMPISAVVGKYYVVADYDVDYDFKKFYLVDLTSFKVQEIEYHNSISFDSYVMGVVDNSAYIFDRDSKKQYEVNTKTKTVVEVGNVDSKVKYYNSGTWEEISAYECASTNKYFITSETLSQDGYAKVEKVGNTLSGFYYYYKKVGNSYEVYRSNIQDPTKLTYLFTTGDISKIQYVDEFVYFQNGNTISYYSDKTGVRKLYQNTELQFNSSLIYGIYK